MQNTQNDAKHKALMIEIFAGNAQVRIQNYRNKPSAELEDALICSVELLEMYTKDLRELIQKEIEANAKKEIARDRASDELGDELEGWDEDEAAEYEDYHGAA